MTEVNKKYLESELFLLKEIEKYKNRPPFGDLYSYLIKQLNSLETDATAQLPCSLGPDLLQYLLKQRRKQSEKDADLPLSFVADEAMNWADKSDNKNSPTDASIPYYETFIAQTNTIPTRNNWHDFYNGLIWLQFPKTKSFFNQAHQQEIVDHGRRSRTPVRDKLTHFDECGLVLITDQIDLHSEIREHNWHQVFVKRQHQWHSKIKPIIVGHALWEMLMQPFIGLTAKVCIIYDPELLTQVSQYQLMSVEQSSIIDTHIHRHLIENDLLTKRRPWLPIPLLGIPSWSHLPQTPTFYADQAYFMPKSNKGNK